MSDHDPWISKRAKEEHRIMEGRRTFELIMQDVDDGKLSRDVALALLAMSELVAPVREDMVDTPLPGMEDGDV